MKQSSILYENASRNVFLIDIPTSITLAQNLPQTEPPTTTTTTTKKKHLISTPPLRKPYPSSPEPKTNASRARLLERIPVVEREFHALIQPLVRGGLNEIYECYAHGNGDGNCREWCFGRLTIDTGKDSRKRSFEDVHDDDDSNGYGADGAQPPVILSPTCANCFGSATELSNAVVKNPSSHAVSLVVPCESSAGSRVFAIPALSKFLLCTLSTSQPYAGQGVIPGLSESRKFNVILLDPPWPNRSVRRSRHYQTQAYFDMDGLSRFIRDILRVHLLPGMGDASMDWHAESQAQNKESIAAIWITNAEKSRRAAYDAMQDAGLAVCEEWVWVKTTTSGEPVMPVDGLWRKPYEVLVIGKKRGMFARGDGEVTRRVIAAVPDVHSRKPNLKEVFERVFFGDCEYQALEAFARNLTAGWWAVGNEVLKFNEEEWWVLE